MKKIMFFLGLAYWHPISEEDGELVEDTLPVGNGHRPINDKKLRHK
jgi:hypothetical protein